MATEQMVDGALRMATRQQHFRPTEGQADRPVSGAGKRQMNGRFRYTSTYFLCNMRLHMRIDVSTHFCAHISTACMCTHVYRMYVQTSAPHIRTHIRTHVRTHVRTHTCTRVCAHNCTTCPHTGLVHTSLSHVGTQVCTTCL